MEEEWNRFWRSGLVADYLTYRMGGTGEDTRTTCQRTSDAQEEQEGESSSWQTEQ